MSKKWHVYYRVFNPMRGEMETMRDYAGLYSIKDIKRRYEAAMEKCDAIHEKLKSGWRPFNVVQVENVLAYFPERQFNKTYLAALSVEAVASEYLSCKKITDSMRQEFTSKARGFVSWLKSRRISDLHIALIDNKTILSFFQFLMDDLGLSGNTFKKYKQTLRSLWDYAIEKKYVTVNIITNIPICNRKKDEAAKPIRDEDLKKLFALIYRDPQLELACKLELFCLLRPGKEVRMMKIGMIDFANSILHLPAEIVKNTNPSKKRSKTTTIPAHFLNEMIEKFRLNTYPKDYYVFGKSGMPGPAHIGKNTLRTRFRNIRQQLGLPEDYKLYSMKHTGVSAMLDMNFHPNEIAAQAGWSTVYMLDVYAKHKATRANDNIRANFNPLI